MLARKVINTQKIGFPNLFRVFVVRSETLFIFWKHKIQWKWYGWRHRWRKNRIFVYFIESNSSHCWVLIPKTFSAQEFSARTIYQTNTFHRQMLERKNVWLKVLEPVVVGSQASIGTLCAPVLQYRVRKIKHVRCFRSRKFIHKTWARRQTMPNRMHTDIRTKRKKKLQTTDTLHNTKSIYWMDLEFLYRKLTGLDLFGVVFFARLRFIRCSHRSICRLGCLLSFVKQVCRVKKHTERLICDQPHNA